MGLQEKRLAKDIQDNALPAFMAEVKSIAGFEPELKLTGILSSLTTSIRSAV